MLKILLDTHILIRWRTDKKRLSREQLRILDQSVQRFEPVAVSAMTLLELAMLVGTRFIRSKTGIDQLLDELSQEPVFEILPITLDVAREASRLTGALRDPADCAIVATARVHGLRLLTADQRIIDSHLVSTI